MKARNRFNKCINNNPITEGPILSSYWWKMDILEAVLVYLLLSVAEGKTVNTKRKIHQKENELNPDGRFKI